MLTLHLSLECQPLLGLNQSHELVVRTAVEVTALLGDVDGNGLYTTNDAVLIADCGIKLISGFQAYPLVDPAIVGDVLGLGQVEIADAEAVYEEATGILQPGIIPNPPQPKLAILATNNLLYISWPQCADGYFLEKSSTVETLAGWTAVTNTPVSIGDQNIIIVAPAGTAQFYRLDQQ